MPCYRCGTRQVDPDRGSSPWLRGVRADRQVLICPGCQADGSWVTDLDRCAVCASVHLVRRLGEAECRDCGAVGSQATGSPAHDSTIGDISPGAAQPRLTAAPPAGLAGGARTGLADDVPAGLAGGARTGLADEVPAGLAEEVEQALARVLRWPAARTAGIG